MAQTVEYLGTTDDVTTCWLCGRDDLKGTVALRIDGLDVFYGSDCAARTLGRTAGEVKIAARAADRAAHEAAMIEGYRAAKVADADWDAFCDTFGGIPAAVQHFGGFTAARAAFAAVTA